MRDGTGTFEPISRDWFTTDPRRDAPNAGVYSTSSSSSSSPLHTRSVHRRRRPSSSSEEPDPIRSDPIQPPPSARMGTDDASGDDSLGGEPIDRWTRTSSPSLPCALAERKTNEKKETRRVASRRRRPSNNKRTRPGWRRAWRGTSSFNRSCVDMSSTPSDRARKFEKCRVRGTQNLHCDSSVII